MQKPKRYDFDKLGFLVSDRWRVYKQVVRERSGYMCEFCKIRVMCTAHHRINERLGYGYDQPPVLDLMAICFVCHEFIHRDTSTKTDEPEFGVNSPGDLKDRGFSTSNDTPGHWKNGEVDGTTSHWDESGNKTNVLEVLERLPRSLKYEEVFLNFRKNGPLRKIQYAWRRTQKRQRGVGWMSLIYGSMISGELG